MAKRIVVIGAGPTGLGAAYRLRERGHPDWHLYERHDYVGGLSASFVDEKGFTWDVGGHVVFSHYGFFDRVFAEMLKTEYLEHLRESWIWILDRWVPYPFQNNIRYLPKDALLECLLGLVEVAGDSSKPTTNFRDWILQTFGAGIAKYFMLPYNFKVWAWPPERMQKEWIAERVSVVDFGRVLRNVIFERDDVGWGPNSTFRFPLHGGTGEIYCRMAPLIEKHLSLNKELVRVEPARKRLTFADGTSDAYDVLINTAALDQFVHMIAPPDEGLRQAAEGLKHNGAHIVGIGLERPTTSNKCWMYFPQNDSPFYRVTYFSNYSYNNVPGGDTKRYHSLMCETSFSEHKAVDKSEVVEQTIQGLINSKMIAPGDRQAIVSDYVLEVPYAYPIPSLERDAALRAIQPALERCGILSRGRFGAWRYEIGNMDHSLMMGAEAVDRALDGTKERVWFE